MADNFLAHNKGLDSPFTRQWQVMPNDDSDLDPKPRSIYCRADGTLRCRTDQGEILTYPMVTGEVLPGRITRVFLTGTTGTYYGWE